MANTILFLRGLEAARTGVTPAVGEPLWTTDNKELWVGDGSTAGGIQIGTGIANIVEDTTPQLGGQLDINGFDIGDGTRTLLSFTEDGSAVNWLDIENEATGSGPILKAVGADTNVDLLLVPKGSGNVSLDGLLWPNTDGTIGQVLQTDGDGNLSFTTFAGGSFSSLVEDTSPQLGGQLDVNGFDIGDGTRTLLSFTEDASSVNWLDIENEATGSGPKLKAVGADTDIDLLLTPKGTGDILVPNTYVPGTDFSLVTKTYVDSQVTDQDLDFTTNSGGGSVDLDSQTFTISGGTNVNTSGTGQAVTVNLNNSIDLSGTLDVTNAATFDNNVVIAGDLTVNGTTTTVDTTNLLVEDPLIVLSRLATGAPSVDAGLVIERGASINVAFVWDESADLFVFVNTTEDGATAGNIAISSYAAIKSGAITGDDSVTLVDAEGTGIVDIAASVGGAATNVDILMAPAGTGNVMVPSGYAVQDAFSLVTRTYVDDAVIDGGTF